MNSALDSTEVTDDSPQTPLLRTRRGRFVLNGQIVYVIGVGPVALRPDSEAADRALVDRLSGLTTNHVRFRLRLETWAFCADATAMSPWVRTQAGWDLNAFDVAFWDRAHDLATYAHGRGVLLEFVMFDAATLKALPGRSGWWRNPLNESCGGFIPAGTAYRFYQMARESVVESFVLQGVEAFAALPNVTWELISSMDGADPVRIAFVAHYVNVLRHHDVLDRLVAVSRGRSKRTDSELYQIQGVDTVGFDWRDGGVEEQGFAETIETLIPFGKPVVNHRVQLATEDTEAFERERIQQAVRAGGHTILRPETVMGEPPAWLHEVIAGFGGRERDGSK